MQLPCHSARRRANVSNFMSQKELAKVRGSDGPGKTFVTEVLFDTHPFASIQLFEKVVLGVSVVY